MRTICSIPDCDQYVIGRGWCREHYHRWRRHGDPLAGRVSQGVPMRWLRAHVEYDGDDCLIWPFRRGGRGYAYVAGGPATRVMCELAHGDAPSPTHDAAHSCGKGHTGCINPKHLRWATRRENERDKSAHGTRLLGSQISWSKLTEADVRKIRSLTGQTQAQTAAQFGVSRSLIGQILCGNVWRHVA